MWLGLRRRASRKKVNKIIKCGVQIAGAFKCKRVTNTAGEIMMFGVMSEFVIELELSSLAVSQAVGCAGRGCDKITKVRVEGVIGEGDKNVWAEARSGAAMRVVFKQNCGSIRPEWVEMVHPSRRLGKLVSQDVRDLCAKVFAHTFAG